MRVGEVNEQLVDAVFPFGFPFPTAFYLTLYVITFALHQAFVHYVLAGSLYVTWSTVFRGREDVPRADQPLAAVLRDWSPFALSAAITVGIAPLLFVQILYRRHFYTANLLLAWRWMIVIPVLIVVFYLLYLIKSSVLSTWKQPARIAVVVGTTMCLLFVGFCFTANHLLGMQSADWPAAYASGDFSMDAWQTVLRMLVWIGGSFATMAVIAGWQLSVPPAAIVAAPLQTELRRLTAVTLCGLAVATVSGTAYLLLFDQPTRAVLVSSFAIAYLIALFCGLIIQSAAWIMQWRGARIQRRLLALASVGVALSLVSASVVRETIRLRAVNVADLFAQHADAASIGGLPIFLGSAVVNFGLIAYCIRLVRSTPRPDHLR